MNDSQNKKKEIKKKVLGEEMFEAIKNQKKNFDVRIDDFELSKGDLVTFEEFDSKGKKTGRKVQRKVNYVLKTKDWEGKFWDPKEAREKGFLVMGLEMKTDQDYLEGWKRAKSDLANLQKRVEQEKEDLSRFVKINMINEFLAIKDNFDEALKFIPSEIEENPWMQGIKYIDNQFDKFLTDNGLTEIKVQEGEDFDPQIHEALKEDDKEAQDLEHSRIKKILKKGYKMNDRVIRPVLVLVGSGGEKQKEKTN